MTAGEVADDDIIRRMRIERWVPKATGTYSEYVIIIVFLSGNNGKANARQKYVCAYIACHV